MSILFDDDEPPRVRKALTYTDRPRPSNRPEGPPGLEDLYAIAALIQCGGDRGFGWYARSHGASQFAFHATDPLKACTLAKDLIGVPMTAQKPARRKIIT